MGLQNRMTGAIRLVTSPRTLTSVSRATVTGSSDHLVSVYRLTEACSGLVGIE